MHLTFSVRPTVAEMVTAVPAVPEAATVGWAENACAAGVMVAAPSDKEVEVAVAHHAL
jgi:hypothetical protein